jgi:ABC-2 type transport system permease protein
MTIFKGAVKRIFKNKVKLLVLLIMPIIFILMFAMQSDTNFSIGIVDKDGSSLSKQLIKDFEEMYRIRLVILDEKDVQDKAVTYQTEYTLIIESGFEESILSGKTPEVKEFYLHEKEKLFYARAYVENYISNMSLLSSGVNFDKLKFEEALEDYNSSRLSFINESSINKELPQSRLAAGFLAQFMLYMSVVTAVLIAEDRSSGVFYRVFYAPVTIKQYLLENLAAFLISAAAQVVIILLLMQYVIGLKLGSSPAAMYALFLAFALVCVSMGMLIVSLVKKPLFAYIIIILITSPIAMLGGSYWPTDMMPEIMQQIAHFLPNSWVMKAVEKILFEGKGLAGILLEILVLLGFTAVFMAGGFMKKVDVSK